MTANEKIAAELDQTPDPRACPACSFQNSLPYRWNGREHPVVRKCQGCGGIFTQADRHINLGHSYELVANAWDTTEGDVEQVYFDFTTIGPGDKIDRRHGWFNPVTRKITQTG